jgi:L,D-transpeptidase catalytic domain
VQVAKGRVSTGMAGHVTPMGVFSVLKKEWWHRSNLYSGAPMPFMQRLTWSGIAMHAGELPGYRASHGCIRLPESFALRLWYMSNVGARVVIAWNELSPLGIEHPLLFQPHPAPQPLPQPPANLSTSIPGEDVSVSMNVPSSAQDLADAERDRMMLAAADDGERSDEVADDGSPALQSGLDLEDGNLEPQPVLELLSARRKLSGRNYARAPEAEYAAVAKSNTGALSIFISRRDARLYVRKDAHPLFDTPITIAEPEKPLGTHVFTAVSAESASKLRWTVVSLEPGCG